MSDQFEHRDVPPGFPDEEDDDETKDDHQMFVSASLPATDDVPLDEEEDDDEDNPFSEPIGRTSLQTNLQSTVSNPPSAPSLQQEIAAAMASTEPTAAVSSPVVETPAAPLTASPTKKTPREYNIEITVSDPTKVGEVGKADVHRSRSSSSITFLREFQGISSYMTYRISTKTSLKMFKKSEFSVNRRFSDFLGLHNRLVQKHLQSGVFLPSPPEKDSLSMAKVKISKDEAMPTDFIDRRRSQLERYLNRLAHHQTLVQDPDFREFIEMPTDLPKSSNTQALSGAGVLRALSNISSSVTKLTTKTNEQDQWFEEKHSFILDLHQHFKDLYNHLQSLYNHHKESAHAMKSLSTALNHLATIEEHTMLSSALIELANVQDKLEQIQLDHSMKEFGILTELIKEYVSLLEMVQLAFQERMKIHQQWLNAEDTLKKKREAKVKLEQTSKNADKLPQMEMEINDWEGKVDRGKDEFQRISNSIKEELDVFEQTRVEDFQNAIEQYLKEFLEKQEKVLDVWEHYLPEAQKITV